LSGRRDKGGNRGPLTAGAQDSLDGSFDGAGSGLFDFSNFVAFTGLTAGSSLTSLLVSLDVTGLSAGLYNGEILLHAVSSYTGLSNYNLGDVALFVTARIGPSGAAPEPPTLALFLAACSGVLWLRRRHRVQGEVSRRVLG
jgi:hypothetical protein